MATIYTNIASNKRRSFILIFLFVLLIVGLGYIFSIALDIYWIFPLAIILASIQAIASYWWSDKMVLAISGAKEVDRNTNQELYRLVENLAIASGLPKPRVYVIEDTAPNAFATGRDPNHAVICVTTGLIDKLDKQELEGVIAHELSHIGNFDIRLATIVVILVGIVVLVSDWFLRMSFFGVGGDDDSGSNNQWAFLAGLILALLAPLFAVLMQLALSRKREYLADADGALLTRNPEGLARALEKIAVDKEPLEAANKATAHLYIADPMKELKGTPRGWFSGLFATHPPIPERVKRLREMAM
jgi:heat shock protein HtpX